MAQSKESIRLAVALEYREGEGGVPSVSACAEGEMAERVVRLAGRYGVPVVENSKLARVLGDLHLDQEIPQELYEAVAIVLETLEGSQPSEPTVRRR